LSVEDPIELSDSVRPYVSWSSKYQIAYK
jgi:hypothetical protein